MELKGFLTKEDQVLLEADRILVSEEEAYHLLMTATEKLNRNEDRLNDLRGQAPGQRAALNTVWNENKALKRLAGELERLAGVNLIVRQ